MIIHNEQEAIQQAIEGGWLGFGKNKRDIKRYLKNIDLEEERVVFEYGDYDACDNDMPLSKIFQDPLFWKSLGKARGWGIVCNQDGDRKEVVNYLWKHDWGDCRGVEIDECLYNALKYFETKLTNGDINKFWESLP